MSAPQMNVYSDIHKGIRWQMYRAAHRAGVTDWSDEGSVQALDESVGALVKFLRDHIVHENTFLHPLIARRAPGIVAVLDAEHDEHEAALTELEAFLAETVALPVDDPLRPRLGLEFYRLVNRLVELSLPHFDREETQVIRTLWDTCATDEVFDAYVTLLRSLPPQEMEASIRAILPAVTIEEQAAVMGGARQMAPPEAFAELLTIGEAELSPEGAAALRARLGIA